MRSNIYHEHPLGASLMIDELLNGLIWMNRPDESIAHVAYQIFMDIASPVRRRGPQTHWITLAFRMDGIDWSINDEHPWRTTMGSIVSDESFRWTNQWNDMDH